MKQENTHTQSYFLNLLSWQGLSQLAFPDVNKPDANLSNAILELKRELKVSDDVFEGAAGNPAQFMEKASPIQRGHFTQWLGKMEEIEIGYDEEMSNLEPNSAPWKKLAAKRAADKALQKFQSIPAQVREDLVNRRFSDEEAFVFDPKGHIELKAFRERNKSNFKWKGGHEDVARDPNGCIAIPQYTKAQENMRLMLTDRGIEIERLSSSGYRAIRFPSGKTRSYLGGLPEEELDGVLEALLKEKKELFLKAAESNSAHRPILQSIFDEFEVKLSDNKNEATL